MALIKREYTDTETVITAENLNDIQDAVIALEEGLFTVDDDKSGVTITMTDASSRGFRSFNIYGKTTQDGTPTPETPVELVSVGGAGSITVNVTGDSKAQSLTIATPNGLPGIPVTAGGNYTDANGQQWICDEIDFARGVYVQRINKLVFDGTEAWHVIGEPYPLAYLSQVPFSTNEYNGFCSHSRYGTFSQDYEGNCAIAYSNGILRIRLGHEESTGAFVEYLAGQYSTGTPVTMLYTLATPIETPLSTEELNAYAALHTYKEFTTVSNDSLAYMELEYVMDAKKYIDSRVTGGIVPATVE